jgi:hypothetical protein
MSTYALLEISGGKEDGAIYFIDIDPTLGTPIPNWELTRDATMIYDPITLDIIGRRLTDGEMRTLRANERAETPTNQP